MKGKIYSSEAIKPQSIRRPSKTGAFNATLEIQIGGNKIPVLHKAVQKGIPVSPPFINIALVVTKRKEGNLGILGQKSQNESARKNMIYLSIPGS